MRNIKNKKGFTLIELIVVIAILGILMLILVPSFLGYAEDARTQVNQANARTLWTAAKAAETKSEYDDTIVVKDCAVNHNETAGFCFEVLEKAGTSFKSKFSVATTKEQNEVKVKSVTYVNGAKNCVYEPSDPTNGGFKGC